MMRNSQDISCEIVEQLLVIEERNAGWNLELNLIKWNDGEPKYDIRPWNEDHSRSGKGLTLTLDNLRAIVKYAEDARIWEV